MKGKKHTKAFHSSLHCDNISHKWGMLSQNLSLCKMNGLDSNNEIKYKDSVTV